MTPPPLCKNCGGGLPQHLEGPCWCKECLSKPTSERCLEYVPRPPQKAEKSSEGFGKKPPKPPKKAPKSMSLTGDDEGEDQAGPPLPFPGTEQREVLDVIHELGEKGAADFEIALKTERKPRDVAAIRSELVADGLLWDSGIRRRDNKGHENVAWTTIPTENGQERPESGRLLVRDDVYVEQNGLAVILHAGQASIRLTGAPGDLVEIRSAPQGSDPDQDGGGEATLLMVIPGSEEAYVAMKNPFAAPLDILETMNDLITPALNALTGIRKDI